MQPRKFICEVKFEYFIHEEQRNNENANAQSIIAPEYSSPLENEPFSIRKVFASTTPGVHIQIALPSKFKMDVNIWKLLERGAAISIIRQVALFM